MLYMQPNICFVVGLVCSYQSNPGLAHLQAVKIIFRYLHGRTDLFFSYQNGGFTLRGYLDVD